MGRVCLFHPTFSILITIISIETFPRSRLPGLPVPLELSNTDWKIKSSLKGITSKLDYLKSLGIDIVWVSPSKFLSLYIKLSLKIGSIQKPTESKSVLKLFYRAVMFRSRTLASRRVVWMLS